MAEGRRITAMLICLLFLICCLLPIQVSAQTEPTVEQEIAPVETIPPETEDILPAEEAGNLAPPTEESEPADPSEVEEDDLNPPEEDEIIVPSEEEEEPADPPAKEPEPIEPPAEDMLLMPLSLPLVEETVPKTKVLLGAFMTPTLLLLPQDGDAEDLTLPTDAFAMKYPRGFVPDISVKWDFNGFDSALTGRQTIRCEIILPEEYAYYSNDEEARLFIEQPVWVYSEGMTERETLSLFKAPVEDGLSFPPIPLNASDETLAALFASYCRDQITSKTTDGFLVFCDYCFDPDLIDTTEAGCYAPFVPEPPPGLAIAEADLNRNEMTVLVVDPDRVDLTGVRIDDASVYSLYGEWLYEAENPLLWVSESTPFGEEAAPQWLPFSAGERAGQQSIALNDTKISASLGGQYLRLSLENPPESGTYWLQIRYEGGESNILQVELDHGAMTAAAPHTGDRIGDIGGNDNPPKDPEPKPPETGGDKRPSQPSSPVTPVELSTPVQDDPQEPMPDETDTSELPEVPGVTFAAHESAIPQTVPVSAGAIAVLPASAPLTQSVPVQTAPEENADPATLDGVAVTGAHLRALLEAKPEQVPFRQGDVEVWLPAEALAALDLRDDDVFAVRLDYQPLESLTVLLTVNDAPVPLGAAFAAAIPWDGTEVQCHHETDETVASTYDASSGILRLQLTSPGTVYFLLSEPSEAAVALPVMPLEASDTAQGNGDFLLYAVGFLGVGGMGGTALWLRKKQVKR